MRVIFAASEIFPYSKSGGLADVAYSLPKELSKYVKIFKVTPLYSFIDRKKFKITPYKNNFFVSLKDKKYKIELFKDKDTIFVYNDTLCDRKNMYGYEDDYLRFAIFCKAILSLQTMLKADILHLNDWHSALCALWAKEQKNSPKVIFTIHNLAYQGIFDKSVMDEIGLDKRYFNMEALEFYSKVNYLKAGIAFSDIVTTVSPTYAKEIQTKEYGCGLEGFLKKYSDKLLGILNGIDTKVFDPKSDKYLFSNYDTKTIANKSKNKEEFTKDVNTPLFIFIGRLVEQKGLSLILQSLDELSKLKARFILLGEGDKKSEELLSSASKKYKNISYIKGYDEKLSHRLYAGADFLLMPSLFEPCGLNQMIAARYGTIPIVHLTGGLKDSVFEKEQKCARGITFEKYDKNEFLKAIKRALELYEDKESLSKMIKFDMECDFSFKKSAKKYLEVYKKVLSAKC